MKSNAPSSYPNITPRLWLVQIPDSWRNIALIESNTPVEACDQAARLLKMKVGAFRPTSTESGRRLERESAGDRLFATNVTGILALSDANRLDSPEVAALVIDIEDTEEFIAPLA